MKKISIYTKLHKSPLARGFGITLLGSGISKVVLMLATFIFTHILSKEDFGSFSFIRNTLNIILCICALNYVGILTKFTAELEYKKESNVRIILVFSFSLVICLIIGLTLMLLPTNVMNNILGEPSLNLYFRIVGLLLPIFMLQPLIEGVLRGYKKFKIIGTLQVATSILFIIAVVIGTYISGLNGAIIGIMLYYFMYAISSVYILIKTSKLIDIFKCINWHDIKKELKILWTMVVPIFILSFIEAPVNWWLQVLMSKYDSIGSIGSMSAILQIRNLLIIIPNYFFSTFTTFQATLNAQGKHYKYFNNLTIMFFVCLAIGIIGTILMSVLGNFLLGLYGSAYTKDLPAFYIAMSTFPLLITISLMKTNMLIMEHQKILLIISIISSILQLATMYILLPKGENPVSAYFWSQITYCIITFIACSICCIYDKIRIKK